MKTNLTCSIIICTCNRLEDIIDTLLSFTKQTSPPDEIIIVDSSDEPLNTQIKFTDIFNNGIFQKSKLKYEHSAKGLPLQRNIGSQLASGDILYFFDDDVLLDKDYLEQMNTTFGQNPNFLGGMGTISNIIPKKLNLHRLFRMIFLLSREHASGIFTISGQPTHSYGLKNIRSVQVLGGCCMAYRKKVFKKHSFDENLPRYAYMEDCDFSYRVSQDGPLFYNPQAILKHLQSPLERDQIIDNRAMYMRHYTYLFFKNFYPKNRLLILPFMWSLSGLFLEAFLLRKQLYIKGYIKGLKTPIRIR